MNRWMRFALALTLVVVFGIAIDGCAYYNARSLAKSDDAAEKLVAGKIKGAKSLDEAGERMKSIGFTIIPRRPLAYSSADVEAAGEGYLECTNVVAGSGGSSSITVDVDVEMSPEGVPVVRRLERHESRF